MQVKENGIVNFFKRNPPLTLFFVCLISLGIATLSLAFYVKNVDKLMKWDEYMDTRQLKLYLNNLQICLETSKREPRVKREVRDVSVTASVPLRKDSIDSIRQYGNVNGLIDLKGFRATCPTKRVPDYLEMRFNADDVDLGNSTVCVQLSGPEDFLKDFQWTPCRSTYKFKHITGSLKSQEHSYYGHFCPNGTRLRLDFPKRSAERPAVYVSRNDKDRIYEYLILVTVALFAISTLMFAYVSTRRDEL